MPKTVIEKIPSTNSSVTVFKIGGTLGFHEKDILSKLFQECEKRGINRIVMDFSELASLGGGCAKIIRENAENGGFSITIAGASATTLRFLQKKDVLADIQFSTDVKEALSRFGSESVESINIRAAGSTSKSSAGKEAPSASFISPQPVPAPPDPVVMDEKTSPEALADRDVADPGILDSPAGGTSEAPGVICLGLDPAEAENSPAEPVGDTLERAAPDLETRPGTGCLNRSEESSNRELKKKLIQYSTLLTITSDFNRITDRMRLVDAFLLTTIAQVGVERASFFELKEGSFIPMSAKGLDLKDCFPITRVV